ncbi:TRAP transporter small permease subunit [Thalassovita mangrovi]|uniref:TRAP transporter small permease protein n=1 Tax=Thalassovita mangrovi TaxID=2692236 RepID=A0A6L8LL91_9RHOB|nr:TRAP transporter small permease subunit [Thalassovita mangrovi]MYM55280.1 TRAP transporter small permease subunit [Thalassovita mangrovi]
MTIYERTERAITRFAAGLALLGGLGLIFATLVTCLSIILKLVRRVLDGMFGSGPIGDALPWLHAILGEEELVTYGVGFALFAALPWVMIRSGHIRIDLFEPVFGRRLNRFLNLIADIALAAIAYLILTRQWFLIIKKARGSKEPFGNLLLQGDFAQAADRISTNQESQILGLPLWPTYIVAEICVAAFLIVACFCVWRSARDLFKNPQAGQ